MPDFLQMVATFREQMQGELSRSDVLRVLIWPILALLIVLLISLQAKASAAVLISIGVFIGIFLLLYCAAFVFLLFNDRDALRSEKYTLHKMAIEHGLLGDSITGLKRVEDIPPAKIIDAEPTKGIADD